MSAPGQINNPEGKGGFSDHPEHRSPGGWRKENTFSYQYNRFLNMSVDEIEQWKKIPDDQKTVAENLAYKRIIEAENSLLDVKEITDRTEGKPLQKIDQKTEFTQRQIIIEPAIAPPLSTNENDVDATR